MYVLPFIMWVLFSLYFKWRNCHLQTLSIEYNPFRRNAFNDNYLAFASSASDDIFYT
jgi:hypothetical protein